MGGDARETLLAEFRRTLGTVNVEKIAQSVPEQLHYAGYLRSKSITALQARFTLASCLPVKAS